MVATSHDPFLPTAAELAGEDPGVRETDVSTSERQARIHFRTPHATPGPNWNSYPNHPLAC
eukprot:scaffold3812_cov115-Isochrysis_galbana.AAC.3